jgi:hypothetical protein
MISKGPVAIGKCEDGVEQKYDEKCIELSQSFHIREKDIK